MSKRDAEFQLTKDSMYEGGIRVLPNMNPQSQKATSAQMAQRKIREAKGSGGRRRAAGGSPAPVNTPRSVFSSLSHNPSGVNSIFGSDGAQQQQSQPSFGEGTSSFNFTSSIRSNPFASSTTPNPFPGQTPAISFSQPVSAPGQRGSILPQAQTSYPVSNPFSSSSSSFTFGQKPDTGPLLHPQFQTNSSVSSSTPAIGTFKFGSTTGFSSLTPSFPGSTQVPADNDETMDMSGGSPHKGQTRPASTDQPAPKSAAPVFGTSTSFSLGSANNPSTPASESPSSSHPFSQFLQPKQPSLGPFSNPATSDTFGPTSNVGDDAPKSGQSQPSKPNLNFVFTSLETGKETSKDTQNSSTLSTLKSSATTPIKDGNAQETQLAKFPSFGTASGFGQNQSPEQPGSDNKPEPSNRLADQKATSTMFKYVPPTSSPPLNLSQPSTESREESAQIPPVPNRPQPPSPFGSKSSQATPKVNPFQHSELSSTKKPTDKPGQSPNAASLFRASESDVSSITKPPSQGTKSVGVDVSVDQTTERTGQHLPQAFAAPNKGHEDQVAETSAVKAISHPVEPKNHGIPTNLASHPFDMNVAKPLAEQSNTRHAQLSKSHDEGSVSKQTHSPPKHSLEDVLEPRAKAAKVSHGTDRVPSLSQQHVPPFPTAALPGPAQSAKTPDVSFQPDLTKSGNRVGALTEQARNMNAEGASKLSSQTSDLFSRSLEQASSVNAVSGSNSSGRQAESHLIPSSTTTLTSHTSLQGVPTASPPSTTDPNPVKFKVKSHGPSNIPQGLENDAYVDYDKMYRLRSLNARFKEQIASLGPTSNDFEAAIRFYASHRAAIGHPLGGLYHRAKAGEKRKKESESGDEASDSAKRARTDYAATSVVTSGSATSQPAALILNDGEHLQPTGNPGTTSGGTIARPVRATDSSNTADSTLPSSHQLASGNQSTSPLSPPFKSAPATSHLNSVKVPALSSQGSSISPTLNEEHTSEAGASGKTYVNTGPANFNKPTTAAFSTLKTPKFGSLNGTDFVAAFPAKATKEAAKMKAENKAKRKTQEFDSAEDDEAEYDRRVADEDRTKRVKIQERPKSTSGFTSILSSPSSAASASPIVGQAGSSARDAPTEARETLDQGLGAKSDTKTEDPKVGSISTKEDRDSEEGQGDGAAEYDNGEDDKGAEESDEDGDIQAAMAKSYESGKKLCGQTTVGKSLFQRITKPDAPIDNAGSKTEMSSPMSKVSNNSTLFAPPGTGLFGSRPSTPSLDSPTSFGPSILNNGVKSSPVVDHTWKPGSAIKFGSPSAPTFNITPASPVGKINSSSVQSHWGNSSGSGGPCLFGSTDLNTSSPPSNIFGPSESATRSVPGLAGLSSEGQGKPFGKDSKETTVNQFSAGSNGAPDKPGPTPFLGPSGASSAITSRATSPGLTDHESAADSGLEDQNNDPQSDYMSLRPGEENEEVIFEVRTKVLELMTAEELATVGDKDVPGYKTRGLGPLRVLKHSENGRVRIVMRGEPSANVIINAQLIPNNRYDLQASGKDGASIKMGIYQNGKLKNWVLKLKFMSKARELVDVLKNNESRPTDTQT